LPALVDHCNIQLYHYEESRRSAVAADRRYQDLVAQQIRLEKAGEKVLNESVIEQARAKADACIQRFNERAEDIVATMRLIELCRTALKRKSNAAKASQELLASGTFQDVEVALGEISSELEHLSRVCELVEIYPQAEAPTAVLRRSQILDAALALEGVPPVFFAVNTEDQLQLGNELFARLAKLANPSNPSLGKRKVIEIIDARECLSKHLGLNLKSLVNDVQCKPITRSLPQS
jgi:hypothetical protein